MPVYLDHPAARGEWLTNLLDPDSPSFLSEDYQYIQDKVLGPPQATEYYSVRQLEDMHMVGIYRQKNPNEKKEEENWPAPLPHGWFKKP